MTVQEYRNLRLNDSVLDEKGNITKVYDIDRNTRTVKTSRYGNRWRDFHEVELPGSLNGKK